MLNETLVRSKRDYISNWKKNLLKYILHSIFISFTNMTTDLAPITRVHTHTTTGTPATDLLCNTRPYRQSWHSPSQTLNRLKKVISNFTEMFLQKYFLSLPHLLYWRMCNMIFPQAKSEPSKLIPGRRSLQIKIKNKNRKIIFLYMYIYIYIYTDWTPPAL